MLFMYKNWESGLNPNAIIFDLNILKVTICVWLHWVVDPRQPYW